VQPVRRLPARGAVLLRLPLGARVPALLRARVRRAARAAPGTRRDAARVGRARGRRPGAAAHLLEGDAPARGHRAGAGARPARGLPRRADEWPRSDRPQGDPRPDPAPPGGRQDRVHEHPHPLGRGDAVRPGRDHRAGRDPLRGLRARRAGRRGARRRGGADGGDPRAGRGARGGLPGGAARRRRAHRAACPAQAGQRGARRGAGRRRPRGLGGAAARIARVDLPVRGGGGLAMSSLDRVAAIAGNTLREAIRNRVLYTLLFFALALIGAGVLLSTLSYVERDRILQDVGFAAIRVFGVAIAVFVGIGLLHKEVDRRTIFTILSKPIARSEFLLGKYLGLLATLWLQIAVVALGFAGVSLATGAPLAWAHAAAFLLIGVEVAVVVAIALLFSAFTSPMLASLFTAGLWLIGHLSRDLRNLGAQSTAESVRRATAWLYRALPDLSAFDLTQHAAHQL